MKVEANDFSSVAHVTTELTHGLLEGLKTYRDSLLQLMDGRPTIEYFDQKYGGIFCRKIGMYHFSKAQIFAEAQRVQRFINENAETISQIEYYGTKH